MNKSTSIKKNLSYNYYTYLTDWEIVKENGKLFVSGKKYNMDIIYPHNPYKDWETSYIKSISFNKYCVIVKTVSGNCYKLFYNRRNYNFMFIDDISKSQIQKDLNNYLEYRKYEKCKIIRTKDNHFYLRGSFIRCGVYTEWETTNVDYLFVMDNFLVAKTKSNNYYYFNSKDIYN